MNLQDLANLGDFVGAIGVVLSLIYMEVQIRHKSTGLGMPCGFLPGDGGADDRVELERQVRPQRAWRRDPPVDRELKRLLQRRALTR